MTRRAQALRSAVEIGKALKEGRFPGAFYSGESKRGVWLIPLDDLRAAGFHPDAPWIKRRERSVRNLGSP